eukprot:1011542-Rhodomonas_salina.1
MGRTYLARNCPRRPMRCSPVTLPPDRWCSRLPRTHTLHLQSAPAPLPPSLTAPSHSPRVLQPVSLCERAGGRERAGEEGGGVTCAASSASAAPPAPPLTYSHTHPACSSRPHHARPEARGRRAESGEEREKKRERQREDRNANEEKR